MTFPYKPQPFLPAVSSDRCNLPFHKAETTVGEPGRTTKTTQHDKAPRVRKTAANGEFKAAFTTFPQTPEVPPGALNNAIIQRFNANRADEQEVLRATSRLLRDHATDWPIAQACLEALKTARNPVTGLGIEPNAISFNVAMAACGRWGLAEDAVRWFNDMLARRITPNFQCYLTVIQCCRNCGRSDLALGMLQHMLDNGPKRGVPPRIELVNLTLSACEKTGRVNDVIELFNYVLDRGPAMGLYPDCLTYNAAIWACSKAGRATDGRRIFRQMLEAPAATAVAPDISTFNALLFACPEADAPGLLGMAVARGLLRPSLGFDPARNRLNLHNFAVVLERPSSPERSNCVHPSMGKAIFQHLARLGLINERTRFVIGVQTSEKLETTIAQCMRDQGWLPCHPTVDAARDAHDFGMLMSLDQGLGAPLALNPHATSFRPAEPVPAQVPDGATANAAGQKNRLP